MPDATPSAGCEAAAPRTGLFWSAVNAIPPPSMRLLILLLIGLVVALQYRLWVGAGSLADLHGMQQEIDAQRMELDRLRTRNQELHAEVEDLRSGDAALEERARGELGMIKAGEAFIQVIERPKPAPAPPPESSVPQTAPAHSRAQGPAHTK